LRSSNPPLRFLQKQALSSDAFNKTTEPLFTVNSIEKNATIARVPQVSRRDNQVLKCEETQRERDIERERERERERESRA
jgi:hypothetical protein